MTPGDEDLAQDLDAESAPIPVHDQPDLRRYHLESEVDELAIRLFDEGYTTEEVAAAYQRRLADMQRKILAARRRQQEEHP